MTDEVFQLEKADSGLFRIIKQPTSIVRGAYKYSSILNGLEYRIYSCSYPENLLETDCEFFLQGDDKCRDDKAFDISLDDLLILKHWCGNCGYKFVCNYSYSLGELK